MFIRNKLCKRIVLGYSIFLFSSALIWNYQGSSIQSEEEEDHIGRLLNRKVGSQQHNELEKFQSFDSTLQRLEFWLKNNSRTQGVNLTSILAPKQPRKYLIYICHENCGGWGDRIRGIMSTFMMSLMLNRSFRIEITRPCNVTHVLSPNLYDWGAQIPEFILTDPATKRLKHVLSRRMLITTANARMEVIQNVSRIVNNSRDLNSVWPEDIVYLVTNKDYFYQMSNNVHYRKQFKTFGIMTKYNIKLEILFPLFYEILFRPVARIEEIVDKHRSSIRNHRVICAQIRTGKNPTIPTDKDLPGRRNISEAIFSFIDKSFLTENSKVFLTTDNEQVHQEARRRFASRLLYVDGDITHLDQPVTHNDKACREQDKLFADFYLLGQICDVSIISNSGFGFWGNLRRFRAFDNLFVFCAGKIYKIESMWHLYKMREQNNYGQSC